MVITWTISIVQNPFNFVGIAAEKWQKKNPLESIKYKSLIVFTSLRTPGIKYHENPPHDAELKQFKLLGEHACMDIAGSPSSESLYEIKINIFCVQ